MKRCYGLSLAGLLFFVTVLPAAEVSSRLQKLENEYRAYQAGAPAAPFKPSDPGLRVVGGKKVVVVMTLLASASVDTVRETLRGLGMTRIAGHKNLLSGLLPIERLSRLKNIAGISWVDTHVATRRVGPPGGAAFDAGDTALFADLVRKRYGVDGQSVTIGVLSDSYNCLGAAANDVASGDLPADVQVLQEYPFCEDGLAADEGRAMMQLIHDVAPGARLMFYSAFVSPVEFAQGIRALADAGADILVDDVGYFDMPMFQDGPIAQAVNAVKDRGVSYFSAAGNRARLSYEQVFTPKRAFFSFDLAHDFGSAAGQAPDFYQPITLPRDARVTITLQWDDPAEIAGGAGALSDLDVFLLDQAQSRIITSSQDSNIGHNPVERFTIVNGSDSATVYLYISQRAGPAPRRVKYVINEGPVPLWPLPPADTPPDTVPEIVSVSIDHYATYSSTIYGHPNARGAMAVGAIPYQETPWFGRPIDQARIEPFSSAGGTPTFFAPDGHRLAVPEQRLKPDIVAPDGVDTTFFPAGDLTHTDSDGSGWPNFFGTSAAAPHAAAVAALLLDGFPFLTVDDVYQALRRGSLDLHDPSPDTEPNPPLNPACAVNTQFDWGTGCGLLQADVAFASLENSISAVLVSARTSAAEVTPGTPFRYTFDIYNGSGVLLKNVRLHALDLPDQVFYDAIDGCLQIDTGEASCRLADLPPGGRQTVTVQVSTARPPAEILRFEVDLLTDTAVDLTRTHRILTNPVQKLTGDFNRDGCVDKSDWGILFGVFRSGGSGAPEYDLTGDGQVGLADLTALEALYSLPGGASCF